MKKQPLKKNKMKWHKIPGFFHKAHKQIFDEAIETFKEGTFIIIGVLFGRDITYLAERVDTTKIDIYAIDIWPRNKKYKQWIQELVSNPGIWGPAVNVDGSLYDVSDGKIDMYKTFLKYVSAAGILNNIIPLHISSQEVGFLFEDQSIDFIYIDGDHLYDAVKKDIEIFWPKIKKGGWLAGDDWGTRLGGKIGNEDGKGGVVKAVKDSFKETEIELIPDLMDWSWRIKK